MPKTIVLYIFLVLSLLPAGAQPLGEWKSPDNNTEALYRLSITADSLEMSWVAPTRDLRAGSLVGTYRKAAGNRVEWTIDEVEYRGRAWHRHSLVGLKAEQTVPMEFSSGEDGGVVLTLHHKPEPTVLIFEANE